MINKMIFSGAIRGDRDRDSDIFLKCIIVYYLIVPIILGSVLSIPFSQTGSFLFLVIVSIVSIGLLENFNEKYYDFRGEFPPSICSMPMYLIVILGIDMVLLSVVFAVSDVKMKMDIYPIIKSDKNTVIIDENGHAKQLKLSNFEKIDSTCIKNIKSCVVKGVNVKYYNLKGDELYQEIKYSLISTNNNNEKGD